LGGYGFQGTVTAGDGSNQQGEQVMRICGKKGKDNRGRWDTKRKDPARFIQN